MNADICPLFTLNGQDYTKGVITDPINQHRVQFNATFAKAFGLRQPVSPGTNVDEIVDLLVKFLRAKMASMVWFRIRVRTYHMHVKRIRRFLAICRDRRRSACRELMEAWDAYDVYRRKLMQKKMYQHCHVNRLEKSPHGGSKATDPLMNCYVNSYVDLFVPEMWKAIAVKIFYRSQLRKWSKVVAIWVYREKEFIERQKAEKARWLKIRNALVVDQKELAQSEERLRLLSCEHFLLIAQAPHCRIDTSHKTIHNLQEIAASLMNDGLPMELMQDADIRNLMGTTGSCKLASARLPTLSDALASPPSPVGESLVNTGSDPSTTGPPLCDSEEPTLGSLQSLVGEFSLRLPPSPSSRLRSGLHPADSIRRGTPPPTVGAAFSVATDLNGSFAIPRVETEDSLPSHLDSELNLIPASPSLERLGGGSNIGSKSHLPKRHLSRQISSTLSVTIPSNGSMAGKSPRVLGGLGKEGQLPSPQNKDRMLPSPSSSLTRSASRVSPNGGQSLPSPKSGVSLLTIPRLEGNSSPTNRLSARSSHGSPPPGALPTSRGSPPLLTPRPLSTMLATHACSDETLPTTRSGAKMEPILTNNPLNTSPRSNSRLSPSNRTSANSDSFLRPPVGHSHGSSARLASISTISSSTSSVSLSAQLQAPNARRGQALSICSQLSSVGSTIGPDPNEDNSSIVRSPMVESPSSASLCNGVMGSSESPPLSDETHRLPLCGPNQSPRTGDSCGFHISPTNKQRQRLHDASVWANAIASIP